MRFVFFFQVDLRVLVLWKVGYSWGFQRIIFFENRIVSAIEILLDGSRRLLRVFDAQVHWYDICPSSRRENAFDYLRTIAGFVHTICRTIQEVPCSLRWLREYIAFSVCACLRRVQDITISDSSGLRTDGTSKSIKGWKGQRIRSKWLILLRLIENAHNWFSFQKARVERRL